MRSRAEQASDQRGGQQAETGRLRNRFRDRRRDEGSAFTLNADVPARQLPEIVDPGDERIVDTRKLNRGKRSAGIDEA